MSRNEMLEEMADASRRYDDLPVNQRPIITPRALGAESFQTAEKIPGGIDVVAAAIEACLRRYPTTSLSYAPGGAVGWGASPRELAQAALDALQEADGG